MKTKALEKALSVILTLTMFISLFTCLTLVVNTPMTASATTTNTNLFYINGNTANLQVQFRFSGSDFLYEPNEEYVFTCKYKCDRGYLIAKGQLLFFYYYNSSDSMTGINASNAGFTESYDDDTYVYTARFTIPSDCRDYSNTAFYFGDRNSVISGYNSYFTDMSLKKVSTDTVKDFPEIVSGNTTNGSLSANSLYRIPSSQTSKVKVQSVGSTFDLPTPQYVNFDPDQNNYSRFCYKIGYLSFAAGNYRFEMDCKVFSGTPRVNVGDADANGNEMLPVSAQTNYTSNYDATNYKYTITFTMADGWDGSHSLGVMVGNYGGDGYYVCANPRLYKLDDSGNPIGGSLIKTFASANYTSSSSLASGYWLKKGNYVATDMNSHYFDREDTANRMAHFVAGSNSYQVLAYRDVGIYVTTGTYRLELEMNDRGTDTPTAELRTGTGISTRIYNTLISTSGYTRVYEFNVTSAATGLGIFLGNYDAGSDVDVVYKNMRLYKYINGAYAGANMFSTFNSSNYEQRSWTAGRTSINTGKWTPLNCSSSLLNVAAINNDYFPASAPSTTGTPKMANVYYGQSWRAFIYNDVSLPLQKGHTYQFISDVKVTSGSPTINLFDSSNNNINGNYTSSYNDSTSGSTRTITFTMAKTLAIVRIRIGNYSDDTDVAGSFGNLRLVESGSNTNLIAGLSSDTLQTSAGNRKWQIANATNSSYYNTHDALDIPTGYFEGTAPSNMYYISKVTTAYQGLNPSIKLKANTTYRLDFDWRTYGGAYPMVKVEGHNGSDWSSISQTAVNPDNKMDGAYTALTSNLLPASVMNTSRSGHYAVTFTTPADLGTSTTRNVRFLFGNYITGDSYFYYGRGSMYLGNFVLKESGATGNAFLNGDLTIAKTGDVTRSDNGKFAGFALEIDKNNGSRDLYDEMKILPQPANFFTLDGAAAQKVLRVNGGSYDYFRQSLVLEPSTQYRLTYRTTYTNTLSSQYIENIDSENNFHSITPTSQSYSNANRTKTVIFTTDADLRTVHNNAYISFYLGPNAPDASYYVTDIKLYKWNGSATVGSNLIENGGFFFGDEARDGTAITGLYNAEGSVRSTGAVQLTGWVISGKYEQNTSIEAINLTEGFFESYTTLQRRIEALQKIIIGREARTYAPYEDLNDNGDVEVYDLMRTKNQQVESITGMGAAAKAETFRSTYIDNEANNATNISALSAAGLLATAVSRTYYIDADNGNDSNAGTSPEAAWKTLNKANSVTTSGSAVLFKCGCVWRAKTGTSNAALTCSSGVTYGSYGTGPKPIIVGSNYDYKNRSWTETSSGSHIWYTNTQNSGSGTHTADDVGIIVYNYGALIGNMTINKADLSKVGDFWCRAPGGSDGGEGKVYVYCPSNPATYFNSIEIGQKRNICSLANNVTINNICFKYGGKHGVAGSGNLSNIKISNCEIGYIGGVYGEDARLGNGVEFGLGASNCAVKNSYVYECYDAGLTFQTWDNLLGARGYNNVTFDNNLIENCNYAIEFFGEQDETMSNIYITNNILRGAGYGWSYDERVGYGTGIGTYRTTLLRCHDSTETFTLSNFNITGNIFDCSKGFLLIWWWNASGSEDAMDYAGLNISGNTFYQSESVDYRTLLFKNESNSHYACSTYGVREALKSFEGTSTPSKLNDSKYVFSDEHVLSTY